VTHFATRATPVDDIEPRAIKWSRKAAESIQPIIQSQNHTTSYLWPQERTHTRIHSRIKVISRNQVHAGHRPAHTWFKNHL